MGSLVSVISAVSQAGFGVNILEQDPPGGVQGDGTNVVAVVGHFPWGPVDTVTDIANPGELFQQFAPLEFGVSDSWASLKAFINKTFPNIVKIVRVSPSAQAAATKVYDDASNNDSVTVTAKYAGSVGNSIAIAWAANALDATARDATVSIGTAYSVTYKNVATIVSSALVVTDPGDPFVTFAKSSGATLVPVAASASVLASGADGTPAAGDYTTALAALADASVEFDVGFVAEAPSGILDDVNTAVKTFVDTYGKGEWVPSTPAAQASGTAATYVAGYRSDRLVYTWPRVKTVNAFDADRDEVTVDGNAFAAVAIASVDPEISPGGAPGAQYLRGITGLETGAAKATLETLKAAGVTPWFMSTALGAIMYGGVTTSITAGRTRIFRRRMTDFLTKSMGNYLEAFVGKPLDLNLTRRTLGAITGPEIGGLRAFLENLKTQGRIQDYSVDEFGGNTQDNIDDGQWIILVAVKLVSAQEEIILKATIGEAVQISAAA